MSRTVDVWKPLPKRVEILIGLLMQGGVTNAVEIGRLLEISPERVLILDLDYIQRITTRMLREYPDTMFKLPPKSVLYCIPCSAFIDAIPCFGCYCQRRIPRYRATLRS